MAEEAKGRPDTIRVIVGWFDQYPARYYEMRLDRVSDKIRQFPGNLSLYDDAAVACDRLGKHEEAIAWMGKKRSIMEAALPSQVKEDRYRYLANLGTFYAHQWVSLPKEQRDADLGLLLKAEELIAKAIEENPNAHFGREIYQLNAIQWLTRYGTDAEYQSALQQNPDEESLRTTEYWVSFQGRPNASPESAKHVDGITGLIQLGAAWKSLDVYHTLSAALDDNSESILAQLSVQREIELYEDGSRSIHPVTQVAVEIIPKSSEYVEYSRYDDLAKVYSTLRAAANSRHDAWIAYQMKRYDNGMHPDTHSDFWNGWIEPEFPEIPVPPKSLTEHIRDNPKTFAAIVLGIMAVVIGFFGYLATRLCIHVFRSFRDGYKSV